MILKLLLNTRMIWILLIKISKNIIQAKNRKTNMVSNKELNSIITELFVRGRKIIKEQDKFACSPTGKGLERQTKVVHDQGKKIDAIMDQNKRLAALFHKDDKHLSHKEIVKELVTKSDCNETRTHSQLFCKRTLNHSAKVERFKDIVELTNGIKPDDLIYYFNGSNILLR